MLPDACLRGLATRRESNLLICDKRALTRWGELTKNGGDDLTEASFSGILGLLSSFFFPHRIREGEVIIVKDAATG